MLMEETNEPYGQEQTKKSEDTIITIGNEPVMQSAIDILSMLGNKKQVATMIRDLTDSLSSDMAYTPSNLSKFIGLCNYIKSSLLICEIHHNLESDIDEQVCKECENMLLKGPGSVY